MTILKILLEQPINSRLRLYLKISTVRKLWLQFLFGKRIFLFNPQEIEFTNCNSITYSQKISRICIFTSVHRKKHIKFIIKLQFKLKIQMHREVTINLNNTTHIKTIKCGLHNTQSPTVSTLVEYSVIRKRFPNLKKKEE